MLLLELPVEESKYLGLYLRTAIVWHVHDFSTDVVFGALACVDIMHDAICLIHTLDREKLL